MPGLLDLANELLLQIIEYIHVEDIESFSSCNKRMRFLIWPALKLHLERKIKYSEMLLGDPGIHPCAYSPILLLRDVLETPIVAHYPTGIICTDIAGPWDPRTENTDASIVQWEERLSTDLEKSLYIKETDKRHWEREIIRENKGTTAAFLITLLPNVRSLSFRKDLSLERVVQVASDIAAAQQKDRESVHPLQKLTSVRLNGIKWHGCLDVLNVFSRIPSMRKIQSDSFHSFLFDWDNEDWKEYEEENGIEGKDERRYRYYDVNEYGNRNEHGYNLDGSRTRFSRMSFQGSVLHAEAVNSLVRATKALRSFKYNYNYDLDRPDELVDPKVFGWGPTIVLQSLVSCASHSLVTLVLFGIGMKGPWDWSEGPHDGPRLFSTKSLLKLEALKSLCTHDAIFAFLDDKDGDYWWSRAVSWKTHRMVDIFPPSLERLILFPSFDDNRHTLYAMDDFTALKKSKLPRLDNIKFAQGLDIEKWMRLACESVGTTLESLPYTESSETIFPESGPS